MVNSVGISQGQYVAPCKTNGKNHCRKDELTAYRETISIANQHMIGAALEKDNEAVNCWSKIIDDAQAKIFAIIDQEDIKTAVDSVEKVVDTADKAVNAAVKVTGAVSGAKLSLSA